jgi:hypothetical protein
MVRGRYLNLCVIFCPAELIRLRIKLYELMLGTVVVALPLGVWAYHADSANFQQKSEMDRKALHLQYLVYTVIVYSAYWKWRSIRRGRIK